MHIMTHNIDLHSIMHRRETALARANYIAYRKRAREIGMKRKLPKWKDLQPEYRACFAAGAKSAVDAEINFEPFATSRG